MVTLTWVTSPGDGVPTDPNEVMSGFKEFRVLRSDVGKRYYALAVNGILPAGAAMYQEASYNDGDFVVVGIDNAGNISVVRRATYPLVDLTAPPPVEDIQIAVSQTAPALTHARIYDVVVDAGGADFTIVDNDVAFPTLIEYLDDQVSPTWTTVTTLSAGVTSGRLTKTWVQGTHTFVCVRATQDGVTTEQQCRPLSGVFVPSPVTVQSVSISPATITGAGMAVGTVTLNEAAPSGGSIVFLTSSVPAVLSVPPTVTVLQGNSAATFNVTTANPTTNTVVTITASFGGSVVQNTATVVSSTIITIPGTFSNEPPGTTPLAEHNFNDTTGGGFGVAGQDGTIVTDAGALISPSNVLREVFRATTGRGGQWLTKGGFWYREVFCGLSFKWDVNFGRLPNNNGKLFLFWIGTGVVWCKTDSGSDTTRYVVCGLQLIEQNWHLPGAYPGTAFGQSAEPQEVYANVGAGTVAHGDWFTIEMRLRNNTAGQNDGIVQMWLNGQPALHYTTVRFGAGDGDRFYAFDFTHTWDGGWAPPQDWYTYVDHLYISGKD